MFKRVKLINFRKHREREFLFTPGLNAIRGLNEDGKTTILEGAAYVLFGAKYALRESLDDVVTYGEKPSSLKAEADIEVSGTVYCGKRSKAGAEVWLQGGVRPVVTGQDECTKFWESLLGVSAKVASNLMIANQVSVRGALSQGPSAPMVLIEKLANLSLIDVIITYVAAEIPNGQTKATIERIAALEERTKEAEVQAVDLTPLAQQAEAAAQNKALAQAARESAQTQCDAHRPAADRAQHAKNELQQIAIQHNEAINGVRFAELVVEKAVVPPAPDAARIAELRKQVEDAQRFSKAVAAHKALTTLGEPDAEWEGGLVSLQTEMGVWQDRVRNARESKEAVTIDLTRERVRMITETVCGLCEKDLSNVPEVAAKNRQTQARINELLASLTGVEDTLVEAEGMLADLKAVEAETVRRGRVYAQYGEYLTLDDKYAPERWVWIGPDVSKAPADPSGELAQLEAAQRTHDQAAGAKAQAQANVATAVQRRDALQVKLDAASAAAAVGEPDLAKAVELAELLASAQVTLEKTREAHQTALSAFETAQAVQRERAAALKRLQTDLQDERDNLTEIERGNVLLGKLRGARPQIADRLWKMVLASVSTYFSSIRGRASTVTRADNGFLVDGKPIDGLSGSTLDALGLAIRVALVKTFLPNCGFIVLDEPAAACDDGRETNLLALVASVGFEQVVLVTHSDQSDAFAQQVIQL